MVEQVIHSGQSVELVIFNEKTLDTCFTQEANSTLRIHLIRTDCSALPTSFATDHLQIKQLGKHCTTEIYALYVLRGTEKAGLNTHLQHVVGEGKSQQVIKFVLADQAQGEFLGELKIEPNAQKVEALQTNRNLLLSTQATMRTRPQLEIYADDVKASHGATTGQLDESTLFYMQQRCISPERGKKLLLRAFMADIVDTISDETKRNNLMDAIDSVI